MDGVPGYSFYGLSIINVWLLIKLLISFKFSFSQSFLTSYGNLVTSAKFLSSGMKCDTSENDSPKLVNSIFSSFKIALKGLCKPFPILFADISAPLHSLLACLIRSRIFNIVYIALISGCIWILSQMSSRVFILIYMSS